MPQEHTSVPASLARLKIGSALLCATAWLAVLGIGLGWMHRYESTPGASGEAPGRWPSASRLRPVPGCATLVMFAHPKCPCTHASLDELAALMAESRGRVSARVCFFQPANSGADWRETSLWKEAAAISGVIVFPDEAGREAARFGVETSGDIVLYDPGGRLAFHGGITVARGRAGESAGRAVLAGLLAGNTPSRTTTPVYGCPLTGLSVCARISP